MKCENETTRDDARSRWSASVPMFADLVLWSGMSIIRIIIRSIVKREMRLRGWIGLYNCRGTLAFAYKQVYNKPKRGKNSYFSKENES